MSTVAPRSLDSLRAAWADLRAEEPKLRIRDAADRLGVSEAELLVTRIAEGGVRPIRADIDTFLHRIEELGEVMALTRNDVFVHEKDGVYRNTAVGAHASQVVDPNIDLRIFQGRWAHGFEVRMEVRGREMRSLQFFDAHGDAVHKIYGRDGTDHAAFDALVDELLLADFDAEAFQIEPRTAPKADRPDSEIDVPALEEGWRAMRDTHDFFGLLRKAKVGRIQALRLVDDSLARPTDNGALRRVLTGSSEKDVSLMIFVQSPGTFQIHHGPVKRIVDVDEWLNVMDPGFNLHVREGQIAQSWVVRKPSDIGWVTSLELYDRDGFLLALIFGDRKEDEGENPAWRELIEGVTAG